MQYSQQQLQSILNSTVGTAPNQDDNGCPWATQHCCPSCGASTAASTAATTPVTTLPAQTGTYTTTTAAQGFSTTWPFFPGFPGGCYPPAPPTTVPPQSAWQTSNTAPNQDDNGCPWANTHCCPSCGAATGTSAAAQTPLTQNPLVTNAQTPAVFPSGIAPSMDQNGCALVNGYSIYG